MHQISESSALGVPCLTHVPRMQITIWDVTLPSRFCPSSSLTVVRTAASLHPMHGSFMIWAFPYWLLGVWLENHLASSTFSVGVPRPEDPNPCFGPCPEDPSASLTCGSNEYLPCSVNLTVDPTFSPHRVDFGQRPRPPRPDRVPPPPQPLYS